MSKANNIIDWRSQSTSLFTPRKICDIIIPNGGDIMSRGYGVKYQNKDFVYVSLKKHYCPHCNTMVRTVMVEKVIERNSPEAKDFDFRFGIGGTHFIVDKAKFKWKEFECPTCNTHFTIKEMQQIEGVYEEPEEKAPESKKIRKP